MAKLENAFLTYGTNETYVIESDTLLGTTLFTYIDLKLSDSLLKF